MTRLEAIRGAIKLARTLETHSAITVYRVRPRRFDFVPGYGDAFQNKNAVVLIQVEWVRDGYYAKYQPKWVEGTE